MKAAFLPKLHYLSSQSIALVVLMLTTAPLANEEASLRPPKTSAALH